MHDRYSSCFSRANLRDACPGYWRDSQLWHVQSSNMQRETPKKICHDGESCFLCKRTFSVAKEKIRVFGKSSFDISSLIHRALNVDLTVYVDREQLAICRTQCYSRIVRYKNAVQKVEEIGGEIKRNFGGDFPFRVKRMAKDHFNTSEAKKCLDFGDTPSTASPFGGREATTGNASALRRLRLHRLRSKNCPVSSSWIKLKLAWNYLFLCGYIILLVEILNISTLEPP